ncbi:hypothetical protein GCM10009123_13690 [Kangiella japonica]|uniref:Uroporphyrin-3 C-methyltransferase n=1 Tax=Kangiella japonica TaxID=647384 RepID=A0ABN0SZF6_9GAMM
MSNKDNTSEPNDPRQEDSTDKSYDKVSSSQTDLDVEQSAADSAFDDNPHSEQADSSQSGAHSSEPSSSKPNKTQSQSATKPIKWFILIILLAAIGYAIFFGWQKWQNYQASLDKADRIENIEQNVSQQQSRFNAQLSEQNQKLDKLMSRLEDNQRYVEQLQDQLRTTQRKFQTFSSEKQQDWLFNEAEYLIREASYKLSFTDDAASIIALLQAADNQLASLDDGSLTQLRQAISQDINAVRSSGNLDVEGIAIAIETLKDSLAQLELASVQLENKENSVEEVQPETDLSSWQHFKNSMSKAASKYYTVHQFDESTQPFISPQKDRLLRENILLNLQTAQLAALQNNQALFESNLTNVKQWVEQYFKQKPAATQAFLEQVSELLNGSVELDLPQSLQSYTLIREISQSKVDAWLESPSTTKEAQEGVAPDTQPDNEPDETAEEPSA